MCCIPSIGIKTSEAVFKYDMVRDFKEGYACVMSQGKCGYIDTSGSTIIPFKYDYAWDFNNGLARVTASSNGTRITFLKDSHGTDSEKTHDFYTDYIPVVNDCKFGFIDKQGNEVIPIEYDYASDFRDSISIVSKNGKSGVINVKGELLVPLVYESIYYSECSEKNLLLCACIKGKYGAINYKTGQIVIPFCYDNQIVFSEGRAVVSMNGKYGYIDKSGNMVIGKEWDIASTFSGGTAIVQKAGEPFCLIDKNGIIMARIEGSRLIDSYSDGKTLVLYVDSKSRNRWIMIDSTGKVLNSFNYRTVKPIGNDMYLVSKIHGIKKTQRYGCIDNDGNNVIPIKFDGIGPMAEKKIPVRKGDKWGYWSNYKKSINFSYQEADCFKDGIARVIKNGKCGFIDFNENQILLFIYETVRNFSEGYAAVKNNGKWGFVDMNGKELDCN